jgi:hypothetical protein
MAFLKAAAKVECMERVLRVSGVIGKNPFKKVPQLT